jgi:hypothetical protein
MLTEFKSNLLKSKLKQHSKIPFVYYCDAGLLCIHHLNETFMNKGCMKQHLRGKAHRVDIDTGEPINVSGIPKEILAELKLQKQESKVESKQDNFDELKRKLEFMFPNNPEDIKDLLARYGFEGMIKYDIQSKINSHKKNKSAESYVKILDYLWKQDPSKVLKLFLSQLPPPTKTAESRHELPSKIPTLIPKPYQNPQSSQNEVSLQ